MRVLLIGGSRFSGKQLLFKLAQQNHEITVLNRGTNKIDYPSNCQHIAVDRTKEDQLTTALEGKHFDWVIDYVAMKENETQLLIDLFKGRIKRFLHISTGSIYDLEHFEDISTMPIFEDAPFGSIDPDTMWYSREKRKCEKILRKAYTEFGFPVTMIRPTYIFGPDNYLYREAYFYDRIEQNRPVYIESPGQGYCDFIHAEDLANLCLLALQNEQAIGQAYNATCGEIISGEQFAKLVGYIVGKKPTVLYYSSEDLKKIDWPDNIQPYPFLSSGVMFFSNAKARVELGFVPKYKLEDAIIQTYKWFHSEESKKCREAWKTQKIPAEWDRKLEMKIAKK